MELHPAEKLPGGVRLYAPNLLAVEIGTGPAQPVNTAAARAGR